MSIYKISLSLLLSCIVGQVACRKAEEGQSGKTAGKTGFASRGDIEIREQDSLAYLKGEKFPFTGVVVGRGDGSRMTYFANYEGGKQHGPEIWWHGDGGMRKMLDYEHGEKTRHREWFENGERKIDAMMRDGVAFGRHLKWFEDGSLRFSGNFVEGLLWDGPVKDIGENGEVMWDAVFKRGRYVSGKYPASEKQKLIDGGMLEKEEKEPRIDANRRE
jgi:hypothetical protein